MKPGNAIEVKDLKITYKCVKSLSMRKSLFHLRKSKLEVYEALRGISFEVKKGEIMGIVGKNGSGKSTLLRAIAGNFFRRTPEVLNWNRILYPSFPSVLDFSKKLSGRENIILSGMLLGFSEQEVRDKMDEIIEFANLGKFIDMPVKTYSSGMYSKLAFSITAVLETDIMLIDEVLSVGDAKFKKKSYKKMQELIMDENRTVVIVSHSTETLEKLCTSLLWLHEGEIKMQGDTKTVLDAYNEFMA